MRVPVYPPRSYAVLAAIVLMAVISLVDLRKPCALYYASRPDCVLWLVAFITTLTGQPLQIGRTFITFCACRVASTSPAPRDSLQP